MAEDGPGGPEKALWGDQHEEKKDGLGGFDNEQH